MAETTICVPDIGGAEAEVIEVLVAVGDAIELEQSLITLESDKASMEIPASSAGVIKEIQISVGDTVSEGSAILVVRLEADEPSDAALKAESGMRNESIEEGHVNAEISSSNSSENLVASGGDADSLSVENATTTTEVTITTVVIPDIGTDGEVDLIEISVEVGQMVEENESLVVLESDKASMDVPAPIAGKITKLLVEVGVKVKEGTQIIEMETATSGLGTPIVPSVTEHPGFSDSVESLAKSPAKKAPGSFDELSTTESGVSIAATPAAGKKPVNHDSSVAHAGPAVRKLAREFSVDLGQVTGSGARGRIVKEDLHAYVKSALKAMPSSSTGGSLVGGIPIIPGIDFSKFGETDSQPRGRVDKLTAANMTRSWLNVPHVTQFDVTDITELEKFRNDMKSEAEKRGTKLTPMPFVIKACAVALNANAKFKSSLDESGETLIYKKYCHIGMAVDTPAGLVVPVIRDADQKSIWELSEEIIELAGLAKNKKLKPGQMQGGVFTVSSLGNIGGRGFTPIVNAPEVAILGVSRAEIQPVWNGKEFEPRKLLPVSLSYDHRVINGGDAGRFLTYFVGLLADIRRILM